MWDKMSYVKQPIPISQFKKKELICPVCHKNPEGIMIIKIEGKSHLHPRHIHNNIECRILQFVHKNCKAEYFKQLTKEIEKTNE